jgi:hypothetical protein
MSNPFANRDLTKRLLFPTLSWSSVNAFMQYDKDQWYNQYVLGQKLSPNAAMQAGIDIGEKLANDPTFMPEVPRPEVYEQELKCEFSGMQLVGHLDGRNPFGILEYKTCQKSDAWTQTKVDAHRQLDFYALLIYVIEKIKPEDLKISLTAIYVKESGHFKVELDKSRPVKTFHTQRTTQQILMFGAYLKKVQNEMQEYCINRDKGVLSTHG